MEPNTDVAAQLERLRRNDEDPKLRAFGLERAGEMFAGFYLETVEHLLEQGVRGQAAAATLNQVNHHLQDLLDESRDESGKPTLSYADARQHALRQYDKARFIGLAWTKNEEFQARRDALESQLTDADLEVEPVEVEV